jgi:hypothetical protein
LIEKEVKKLIDAKIIVSLRFSKWVANLVPVRNKSGEIRLSVDFWNLKKVSLKENHDPGGYWWPPTFSKWLKTTLWQFWQFTIFSRF